MKPVFPLEPGTFQTPWVNAAAASFSPSEQFLNCLSLGFPPPPPHLLLPPSDWAVTSCELSLSSFHCTFHPADPSSDSKSGARLICPPCPRQPFTLICVPGHPVWCHFSLFQQLLFQCSWFLVLPAVCSMSYITSAPACSISLDCRCWLRNVPLGHRCLLSPAALAQALHPGSFSIAAAS